ncbi:MAG: hypothetical protein AAGC55_03395, partial [Myxococcota bacterium]
IDGSAQVLWSNESKRGFRRVVAREDLDINVWVKARDLKRLSRRETEELIGRPEPGQSTDLAMKVALNPTPATMRAPRDFPILPRRDGKAPSIGLLRAGTEVYVMETTLDGWQKILPKQLSTKPLGGIEYWIYAGKAGGK